MANFECDDLTVHGKVRIYTPYGLVLVGDDRSKNGIRIISLENDPPELMLESQQGEGLGKIGFARFINIASRIETVLYQGKIDERNKLGSSGEQTLHIRNEFAPGDGMIKKQEIRYDTDMSASIGISSFLRSPNGQFELELQNDGNFVIYDEANGHIPIFDSFSTLVRLAALEKK